MDARQRLHSLLRGVIAGGFSLYITYLAKEDKLIYFIAPRMELIVKLSAIALGLIAIYLIFGAVWPLRTAGPDCCCQIPKKTPIRNTITYLLFVSPLLLGWFTPDSIMGSSVVDVKGIVLTGTNGPAGGNSSDVNGPTIDPPAQTSEEAPQPNLFESDDPYISQFSSFAARLYRQEPILVQEETFLETLTAIDLFMDIFMGKSIEISGFVYREEDMTDAQFVVSRLVMECCSADAMPYGFLVEWPGAATIPQDQWVSVKAVISSVDYRGNSIVLLDAENVELIEAPPSPYVYPNYEALSD